MLKQEIHYKGNKNNTNKKKKCRKMSCDFSCKIAEKAI